MERPRSNIKNYICSCQKSQLSSKELFKHLLIQKPHKITIVGNEILDSSSEEIDYKTSAYLKPK